MSIVNFEVYVLLYGLLVIYGIVRYIFNNYRAKIGIKRRR